MFYDCYVKVCKMRGISPTRVLNDLNISHGVFANWKTGGTPTNPTKQKIAEYFNISIAELMSGGKENPTTVSSNGISFLDVQLMQMLPSLSEQEKRMFLAQMQGVIKAREV